MCRKFLITLLLGLAVPAVGLYLVPVAVASSGQAISDCNTNGHLTGSYSRADLQGALNGMPADVKEYTNCYDVISRALLASAAGGGSPGGGGGSTSSPSSGTSPRATIAQAGKGKHGAPGVSTRGVYSTLPRGAGAAGGTVGGNGGTVGLDRGGVRPGGGGLSADSALPGPLIVVLVLLGLAALSGAGLAIRRRVLTRHGA